MLENGSNWQAVLLYVRSADENVGGWVVAIFWKTEVIGELYYVRSSDENVDGSVVDIFRKNGRNWQAVLDAELERLNYWLLVAFEMLICVDIYLPHHW